jgi:uncharacterized protein (TIGR04551 family)
VAERLVSGQPRARTLRSGRTVLRDMGTGSRLAAAILIAGLAMPTGAWAAPPSDPDEADKPAEGEKAPDAKAPDAKGSDAKPADAKAPEGYKPPTLLDQMDDDAGGGKPAWDAPAQPAAPTFPYFEYHGYFRLRPDLINNGYLGQAASSSNAAGVLTTSSILPPLSRWPENNQKGTNPASDHVGISRDDSAITGANMRFRLEPTLHLSDSIRVHTTIDIFDNYVLGGDPDYAGALRRPDVPLSAFATSSRPGGMLIKEAYGEWKTLVGLLRVGRQASHWGLGILSNSGAGNGWDNGRPTEYYGGGRMPWEGSGYDSDFGTYVDRAAFLTKIAGVYTSVFYDFPSKGVLAQDPSRVDGQVRDLGSADDVTQFGIAILSKPLSPDDVTARKKRLLDDLKPAFDWGVYALYRTQELDSQGGAAPSTLTVNDAKNVQLMQRKAWAAIGDVWARWEQRLSFSRRLVFEGEFASIYGHVDDVSAPFDPNNIKPRDIRTWGGAFKGAWQNEGIGVYLDVGAASGDDTRCFGVYGKGDCSITTAAGLPNETISAFKFHKDFRVDSLLFREVIGAVTNAVYIKPTFSLNAYPFYAQQQLGADLSVMYARAMNAEGTPGNGSSLGTEVQLRGFAGQRGLFLGSVSFAYLLPGDAFTLQKDWYSPNIDAPQLATNAWRLLGHVVLMF